MNIKQQNKLHENESTPTLTLMRSMFGPGISSYSAMPLNGMTLTGGDGTDAAPTPAMDTSNITGFVSTTGVPS